MPLSPTATSTSSRFASADHLLFGTDFPAVTVDTVAWYTNNAARFYESRPDRHAASNAEPLGAGRRRGVASQSWLLSMTR